MPSSTVTIWQRPKDISFVLSQLLADPIWGERIDGRRVGVAGHSSGGYTAIALAGALYDPQSMGRYCKSDQQGPDCNLVKDIDLAAIDFSEAGNSYKDSRIRAVFAMAPAVGQAIEPKSLADIDIPVYVIAAKDDELVPFNLNARLYAETIPSSEFEVLVRGGHSIFTSECSFFLDIVTLFIKSDVCGHRTDVDRVEQHRLVGKKALNFFRQNFQ